MMLTRDSYIAILEKRAADESARTDQIDNGAVAERHMETVQSDDRAYLGKLFDNTEAVQKNQTQMYSKLFPGTKGRVETGNPLIKVGELQRTAFNAFVQETDLLKTASAPYKQVAWMAFQNELEKIAAFKPTTVAQMARRNSVAQAANNKVWGIGTGSLPINDAARRGPASVGGAAAAGIRRTSPAVGSREYAALPIEQRLAISRGQR